jgi:hypothetical protein
MLFGKGNGYIGIRFSKFAEWVPWARCIERNSGICFSDYAGWMKFVDRK